MNSFYNHSTYPTPNSPGSSAQMRAELQLVTAAFDKMPVLSAGVANRPVMVNSAGTALVTTTALGGLDITGSTINGTPIGSITPAPGAFTTLAVAAAAALGSNVTINGGAINGTAIGGVTPAAGAFTTLSAISGITGNLTGNVTGNLTGNVTGNVTGNLAGNVTSTGTSTFNNVTINGTLNMDAGSVGTIENLSAPVNPGDATNKGYVDAGLALKLNLAGGVMSGAIGMGGNAITNLATPTANGDATTKGYVDAQDALKLNLTGGSMTGAIGMGGNRITGLADPVNPQDAATKVYVDNAVQGLDAKDSCRVATTGSITLSGTQTIDGVAVVAGERVLVKDQSTPSQNGIYLVAAGAWTRAPDANTWNELVNAFTFVERGTANGQNGYLCTITAGGTLETTAVTFVQFSGAGQVVAGAGMSKIGNTLNVGTASSARIVVNSDDLDLAPTGITAGTYRSVTVDQWGRATAGTNPTTVAGYSITDTYTKAEEDALLATKLNLSGGTMTGQIAMGTNRVTGVGDPTAAQDAATRNYVDTKDALKLNLTGGTMTGPIAMGANKITGLADPTVAQDAVTLNYVTTLYGSTASAAASASAANTSAINAAASATNANTYAGQALTSANNAAASYDAFDDRYLGAKASDPATDNDGNPLIVGALYWSTTSNVMRVWKGTVWESAYVPSSAYASVSLDGPLEIFPFEVKTYTITDFSAFSTYAVSATAGTVTLSGNQITYTAPSASGPVTITVARDGAASLFPLEIQEPPSYIATPAATPATFGDPFEGGFYAGMIWNQLTQSSDSKTLATGTQTFTVPSMTGAPIVYQGQTVEVRSRANPANKMVGTVTNASGTSLTINITSVGGSGTFSDWSVMARFRIIVAPKASGENAGIALKNANSAFPTACQTLTEGLAATQAMRDADTSTVYPAAHWARNLNIGGRTDWYIPARDELELCWRNLKPVTNNNYVTAGRSTGQSFNYANNGSYGDTANTHGTNNNSSPTGAAYTASVPGQTAATAFRTGGAEAYEFGSAFYWSSSDYNASDAWGQGWSSSYPGHQYNGGKTGTVRVRAVRRSVI